MLGDFRKVNALGQPPVDAHAQAVKVAHQFEDMMVRTFVSAMRETTKIDPDAGGMFGDGPGADTYADWFDEQLTDQVTKSGRIGVAEVLLREMELQGKHVVDKAPPPVAVDPARKYLRLPQSLRDVDPVQLQSLIDQPLRARALAAGGIDVAV